MTNFIVCLSSLGRRKKGRVPCIAWSQQVSWLLNQTVTFDRFHGTLTIYCLKAKNMNMNMRFPQSMYICMQNIQFQSHLIKKLINKKNVFYAFRRSLERCMLNSSFVMIASAWRNGLRSPFMVVLLPPPCPQLLSLFGWKEKSKSCQK